MKGKYYEWYQDKLYSKIAKLKSITKFSYGSEISPYYFPGQSFLLELIPHDLMNQCFILNLNQYLFEKNNYMDFSSHKAGCTRELF